MRALVRSDFTWRFAGGFVLGAVAVGGAQLMHWVGAVAHIA